MASCIACSVDVSAIKEYSYMLRHELWIVIHGCLSWQGGIWCIGCLEEKMGRQLTHGDFDWDNSMNKKFLSSENHWSDRLKNRRCKHDE